MTRYRVHMHYPDGTTEEGDELFATEDEAHADGLVQCSDYAAGGEVLHLHNPGDYPLKDDDDADYDIVEVDA